MNCVEKSNFISVNFVITLNFFHYFHLRVKRNRHLVNYQLIIKLSQDRIYTAYILF